MKTQEKKAYHAPALANYGHVAEVTQNGGLANSDGQGVDTALPNPSV